MLLLGHEHIMKIPDPIMTYGLIAVAMFLIYCALFMEKKHKAHIVAYTMFP